MMTGAQVWTSWRGVGGDCVSPAAALRRRFLVALVFGVAFGAALGSDEVEGRAMSLDWLTQKVCVDEAGRVLPIDPYNACPPGARLRSLSWGEPLPYRRLDRRRQVYRDVVPYRLADGTFAAVAAFDWVDPRSAAGDRYKLWSDGYDTYVDQGGWFSIAETRNGAEYGTSFVGAGCRNYNGLVLFPSDSPRPPPAGSVDTKAAGVAWEAEGQTWPGACSEKVLRDYRNTWKLVRKFPFGGGGGAPVKEIDAIVATPGMRVTSRPTELDAWLKATHLERFYFTEIYGLTRWEHWTPRVQIDLPSDKAKATRQRAVSAAANCTLGPDVTLDKGYDEGGMRSVMIITHQGHDFVLTDCRDWSFVEEQKTPYILPTIPISASNILRNFHFNGSGCDLPDWNASCGEAVTLLNSTSSEDKLSNSRTEQKGVQYVHLICGEGCDAVSLSQEIRVGRSGPTHGAYTIGVIARSDRADGKMELALVQEDAGGAEIARRAVVFDRLQPTQRGCDPTGKRCQTFAFGEENGSVIRSSDFRSERVEIPAHPAAKRLRFLIQPKREGAYDIVSAWLMAAPE